MPFSSSLASVPCYLGDNLTVVPYKVITGGIASLAQLVAMAKQDCVAPDITPESFPVVAGSKGEQELFLFLFGCLMESHVQVFAAMEKLGKRPATIAELLPLGARFSELQKNNSVTALGSVARIKGKDETVCLSTVGRCTQYLQRSLSLVSFLGPWQTDFAHLAANKGE